MTSRQYPTNDFTPIESLDALAEDLQKVQDRSRGRLLNEGSAALNERTRNEKLGLGPDATDDEIDDAKHAARVKRADKDSKEKEGRAKQAANDLQKRRDADWADTLASRAKADKEKRNAAAEKRKGGIMGAVKRGMKMVFGKWAKVEGVEAEGPDVVELDETMIGKGLDEGADEETDGFYNFGRFSEAKEPAKLSEAKWGTLSGGEWRTASYNADMDVEFMMPSKDMTDAAVGDSYMGGELANRTIAYEDDKPIVVIKKGGKLLTVPWKGKISKHEKTEEEGFYNFGRFGEAKEPAKLKGKKLDALISKLYYKHGDRVQVNIFNLSKIANAGKAAYETGGEEAADAAVAAAIAQYREN